ncbi:MAG: DUF4007 family protein [Chloroflexales bacterium]
MSATPTFTFSGHETFPLRATWLKKAYDLLVVDPTLFSHEDAFVRLGVGKNMAQSLRHWGRVCGVFERTTGSSYQISALGHALLADTGWDPFLVTPAGRWLLHWQIVARPTQAFTWFFAFNLFRGGEVSVPLLVEQIVAYLAQHEQPRPSPATLARDSECMLHCYAPPAPKALAQLAEDTLACPLTNLGLLQPIPGQGSFQLVHGEQPDLPAALVAFAVLRWLEASGRRTANLHDLVFAPGSPGRVFRLDEDALLARLQQLAAITDGDADFTETAGLRQVNWRQQTLPLPTLLARAFADEADNG